MTESSTEVQIPKRALFKAAEVCELVKVQPYVLRSWEAEFPRLGIAKTEGGTRVYRRADVEQVLRIKHLLLVDGLTLAGARRRLEEETSPVGAGLELEELMGRNARERLAEVKRGLHSILELLAGGNGRRGALRLPGMGSAERPRSVSRLKAARGKRAGSRRNNGSSRKRSA